MLYAILEIGFFSFKRKRFNMIVLLSVFIIIIGVILCTDFFLKSKAVAIYIQPQIMFMF